MRPGLAEIFCPEPALEKSEDTLNIQRWKVAQDVHAHLNLQSQLIRGARFMYPHLKF